MARKLASQRRSYSSDSSSDSERSSRGALITLELYQQLGTAAALRRPADFTVACSELAQLTRHLFRRCSKALQGRIVEDMMLAVECCDGRLQNRAALAGLVEAAERALPQAKRTALQRKYRESGVALSRRQRRGGGADGYNAEEDEPASFAHLPLDAVRQVFWHLDPISLARSAAVCREWRDAAADDGLWHLHCERLRGKAAAAVGGAAAAALPGAQSAGAAAAARPGAQSAGAAAAARPEAQSAGAAAAARPGAQSAGAAAAQSAQSLADTGPASASCRHLFAAAVRQQPERLLRWRTNRIALSGRKLSWLDPAQPPAGSWRHVGTAAVLAFLRSGGRTVRAEGESSDGSDSSDSGREEEQDTSRRLRFWQL